MSESDFCSVLEKVIACKDISYGAKCAFVALRNFAMRGKNNPTLNEIALSLGCDIRHAHRLVGELRTHNFVSVRSESRRVANTYELMS